MKTTLTKLHNHYKNWKLERQTVNELSALSDRDLSDIGIYRSDIRQFVKDNKTIY